MEKSNAKPPPSFSDLPDEVTMSIFDKLDWLSQIRLRRVCRKWNRMLREENLYSTLRLTEKDFGLVTPIPMGLKATYRSLRQVDLKSVPLISEKLFQCGISQCVRHLIVDGDYNYSQEDLEQPNARVVPYKNTVVPHVVYEIGFHKGSAKLWGKLEAVTIQNAVIYCPMIRLGQRKLTLSKVSILSEGLCLNTELFIENFSAQMSNRYVHVDSWPDSDPEFHIVRGHVEPVELVRLLAKESEAIRANQIKDLEEVYDQLMLGKRGCVIRRDAIKLINEIRAEQDDGDYDPWSAMRTAEAHSSPETSPLSSHRPAALNKEGN